MPLDATDQLGQWTRDFGRSYTDRNTMSPDEMDAGFALQFGVRKSTIYRELVGPTRLPAGRALEVGCNIGLQLQLLRLANRRLELHGLEPQEYALARARVLAPEVSFHQGTAFDMPFPDDSFDLVFTHGVLIHLHPRDLPKAIGEMCRVSRRFILCHEYYARETTEVRYQGSDGLLWKTDFAARFREACPSLQEVAVRYYPYSEACGGADLVDQVVLFEQAGA